MKRIYVVVEGETEEIFVKQVLQPYFNVYKIFLYPCMIITNRYLGRKGKGGFEKQSGYQKHIKKTILNTLNDQSAFCTTMLDLYGLPNDFPGINIEYHNSNEKLARLETALQQDINNTRFIANLVIHEFEGLLFSDINKIGQNLDANSNQIKELDKIRKAFSTPEDINDNKDTAPSKRLLNLFSTYCKPIDGVLIAESIGLNLIKQECQHFNSWLFKLEQTSNL